MGTCTDFYPKRDIFEILSLSRARLPHSPKPHKQFLSQSLPLFKSLSISPSGNVSLYRRRILPNFPLTSLPLPQSKLSLPLTVSNRHHLIPAQYVIRYSRKSLRVLGSVGEPINPSAWRWFYNVVGHSRCPISDTWWQTETGGAMISPIPGAWPLKPGSATFPFFGVQLVIVDEKGVEMEGECSGYLCLKSSWPSAFRTLYGDHERYESTYFKPFPGYYFTGDGCTRDKDGYYWLTGRVDDVINVSGHRIGTVEVESALVSHPLCAEAAVVGIEHEVKGQGIYAFVTLVEGVPHSEELKRSLILTVRKQIGAFAAPERIHWAPSLPKTRSGKIMRRILRKIASKQLDELGDMSTLTDPSVVDQLIAFSDC